MERRRRPTTSGFSKGTAGAAFAEQLIASGVKYVFGGSDSEDAEFYDALVDRPQLQFILTAHEGPGAAMAAGYVKASGEPALVTQAAVIGLMNATGQIFNAFKEQTPLVVYSARAEDSREAGRDAFQELPGQEQLVAPLTKWSWTATDGPIPFPRPSAAPSRSPGRRPMVRRT